MDKMPKEDTQIKKWLIRVATNNCKDYFKSFWKSKVIITDYNNMHSNYKKDNSIELTEFLYKLDKKYRIPIYLYYYEGYKIEEIASILKENISTIKMRMKKAKEMIKKEMENVYEKI